MVILDILYLYTLDTNKTTLLHLRLKGVKRQKINKSKGS